MSPFFICLIQANIALTLFYLAYRLGLRRLTFYTLNRYFLLFGIIFSALCPLPDTTAFFQHHEKLAGTVASYSMDWSSLEQSISRTDTLALPSLLQFLFWAGVAVMSIRFILQLFSLLRIHLKTERGKLNGESVRLTKDRINPFSFFKNIYINPGLHASKEINTILAHEKIHIKGRHSLDILIGEINLIFYWFNPGAWLMKTAIHENLEFITDHQLVRSGINVRAYQYNLLKTADLPQRARLVNNFNLAHLKQRIRMMNKKKTSSLHVLRYFLLLPAIGLTLLVMTPSRSQDTTEMGNKADSLPLSKKVLYIIDGQKTDSAGLGKLDPASIRSISVLKGKKAIREYGKEGKNGVVLIYSKRQPKTVEEEPASVKPHHMLSMPEFPGGAPALKAYIKKHLEYPKAARKRRIEGTVFVHFFINEDGSISQVKATGKRLGSGLEEAAVRLVKEMPDWEPAKRKNGQLARTGYMLPVKFQL